MSTVTWPLPDAAPASCGLDPERLQRVHRLVAGFIEAGQIAGGITAVARGGRLAHRACHGCLDAASGTPMREDAIFRIYSMTKPITSVAALMLYEEGAFLLDDELQRFLPAFDQARVRITHDDGGEELVEPARPITIHDVMTHTAGFTYDLVHEAPAKGWDLAQFVEAFAQVPLIHHPGRTWAYGGAHDVLGHLVEVVSGVPLDIFFRERIFAPLGMVDTGFHVPADKADRAATLYALDEDERIVPTEARRDYFTPPSFLSGGGGLVSTTSDYLRFGLMLLDGGAFDGVRLLGRKTVDLMRADHLPPGHGPIAPFGFSYGLGVSVLRDLGEKRSLGSVGEFGWGGAASTEFWVDPAEDMVSLVMFQLMPPRMMGHTWKVKSAFYQALE